MSERPSWLRIGGARIRAVGPPECLDDLLAWCHGYADGFDFGGAKLERHRAVLVNVETVGVALEQVHLMGGLGWHAEGEGGGGSAAVPGDFHQGGPAAGARPRHLPPDR